MDLIRSLSWISASHLRLVRDDDSHVDRLSHRYTVAICVLFAIIVSTKQYAGDPIDCWVSSLRSGLNLLRRILAPILKRHFFDRFLLNSKQAMKNMLIHIAGSQVNNLFFLTLI